MGAPVGLRGPEPSWKLVAKVGVGRHHVPPVILGSVFLCCVCPVGTDVIIQKKCLSKWASFSATAKLCKACSRCVFCDAPGLH